MLLKKSDFPPLQWHVLKSFKNRQFLTSGQGWAQSNIKLFCTFAFSLYPLSFFLCSPCKIKVGHNLNSLNIKLQVKHDKWNKKLYYILFISALHGFLDCHSKSKIFNCWKYLICQSISMHNNQKRSSGTQ